MKTLKEFCKNYFSNNQAKLQQDYPGINEFILERTLYEWKTQSRFSKLAQSPILDSDQESMLISKLEAGIPLAYITQTTSFYGREFYVDEHVLIPRQETELLCEMIINFINNNHIKKFCEVGVGSGVIAATLVAESNQNIDAIVTDISEAALSIARKNLQTHFENLDSFEFILCDRLRAVNEEFDLIISNPPYIKTIQDRASVHAQVLKYEPSIALFLDDEQYDKWFEDFFMMVNTRLKNNGRFYMEGHENHLYRQAGQITKLFDGSVEIVKDLTGRDRFLIWEKVNG